VSEIVSGAVYEYVLVTVSVTVLETVLGIV